MAWGTGRRSGLAGADMPKKEELNLMNGRFGRKERNEQQGSK
jgi:hypothetical protein